MAFSSSTATASRGTSVANPATQRCEKLPEHLVAGSVYKPSTYLVFDPAVSSSSHYEVFVIPSAPRKQKTETVTCHRHSHH
ncbi:hypothetical protein OsI_23139 [Oryza sativa Indica Group]|uniref:Uncharacterized protein n=1 Tax=Oryza sativa subsp. indica TaxID=39946 RepID=A2YDE8_ORYSI|nr:hypothetical protein OsI_23139 [Oryza sativa Indica Group]